MKTLRCLKDILPLAGEMGALFGKRRGLLVRYRAMARAVSLLAACLIRQKDRMTVQIADLNSDHLGRL